MRDNPVNPSVKVVLSQEVSHPVGNMDNTDRGPAKRNAPENLGTSASVTLDQNVSNPVGNKMSTGEGPTSACQAPLPMRPIPS